VTWPLDQQILWRPVFVPSFRGSLPFGPVPDN
jgi:hypothetical protein